MAISQRLEVAYLGHMDLLIVFRRRVARVFHEVPYGVALGLIHAPDPGYYYREVLLKRYQADEWPLANAHDIVARCLVRCQEANYSHPIFRSSCNASRVPDSTDLAEQRFA